MSAGFNVTLCSHSKDREAEGLEIQTLKSLENLVILLEIHFLVTDLVQPSIGPVPGVCVAFPAPAPGNYELQSLCQEREDENIK